MVNEILPWKNQDSFICQSGSVFPCILELCMKNNLENANTVIEVGTIRRVNLNHPGWRQLNKYFLNRATMKTCPSKGCMSA